MKPKFTIILLISFLFLSPNYSEGQIRIPKSWYNQDFACGPEKNHIRGPLKFEEPYWCYFNEKKYFYEVFIQDGLEFLVLSHGLPDPNPKKYLMLRNSHMCFLYEEGNNELLYEGYAEAGETHGYLVPFESVVASSEKKEKTRVYSIKKVGNLNIEDAWATDVNNGINEKITIESKWKFTNIVISNGYVSYKNPKLYFQNARMKLIRITDNEKRFELSFSMLDTPIMQKIELPIPCNQVSIEILEIFPGSKYQDLCVNFVMYRVDRYSEIY